MLAQAYRNGWSIYVLKRTRDYAAKGEYLGNSFAILGFLVRSMLETCKAISDLNIQLGNWSVIEAQHFIAESTPYPDKLIAREIDHLTANPGLAVNTYLISRELENLHTLAVDEGGISRREFHATILGHSPATVAILREAVAFELTRKF
jgi:uncharacterized protein (DUF885 family)